MPGPWPGDEPDGEAHNRASGNGSDGKGDSGTESDIEEAHKVVELENNMLDEENRLALAKKELELLKQSKVVALGRLMDARRQVLKAKTMNEQGLEDYLRAVKEHEAITDLAKLAISRVDEELEDFFVHSDEIAWLGVLRLVDGGP